MNQYRILDEIKAPEAWKASAKALWNDKETQHKSSLRILRPLPLAAVIAVLLIGTAAAYVSGVFSKPIVVENAEEAHAAAEKILEEYGYENVNGYSYSGPVHEERDPVSSTVEGATYIHDHWQDDTDMSFSLIGIHKDQDWTLDGYDSSEGPLWQRHASTSDGWTKQQYVAETLDALNAADPDSVTIVASLADTGLAPIPFGNHLEVMKDENGTLLGVNAKLCWFADDERYFQLEYLYETNAINWGLSFVTKDAFDEVAEYTAADGREFVITTYRDQLWVESTTPNESYDCYGVGIGIEEAEAILDHISITVCG